MTVLRAGVRRVTGHTRHSALGDGGLRPLRAAAWVRVVSDGSGAYLLVRFDQAGHCITDTWHESVARAKRQAFVEYEIEDADWVEEAN